MAMVLGCVPEHDLRIAGQLEPTSDTALVREREVADLDVVIRGDAHAVGQ
jgi:hypothetical protein